MAQLVHFTENFVRGPDGPTMSFDYRLRQGIATSTNALKLMELVGLPVDVDTPAILGYVDDC
jgi:DNA mismatch repair ATPase MutS